MHKFKHGDLHSGSKSGPEVKDRDQAVAIMLSEKREVEGSKKEYQSNKSENRGKKAVEGLKKVRGK